MATWSMTQLYQYNFPFFGLHTFQLAVSIPLLVTTTANQQITAFKHQVSQKQTYTIGQQFTLPAIYSSAPNFTGPVDIVIGKYDFPFCGGKCDRPIDLAAATIPGLYPAAHHKSESFVVPESGHLINAHYEADVQFDQINNFLDKNGFWSDILIHELGVAHNLHIIACISWYRFIRNHSLDLISNFPITTYVMRCVRVRGDSYS